MFFQVLNDLSFELVYVGQGKKIKGSKKSNHVETRAPSEMCRHT